MWGGTIVKTGDELGWKYPVPDVDKRLIVIPNKLSADELRQFVTKNSGECNIFPHSCYVKDFDKESCSSLFMCDQVAVVRYNWVSDCIAACTIAPLKDYCEYLVCWE